MAIYFHTIPVLLEGKAIDYHSIAYVELNIEMQILIKTEICSFNKALDL